MTPPCCTVSQERVFLEVARQCGVRIRVERAKMRLIECMGLPPEDMALLTSDASSTRFHVVPMVHLRAPLLRRRILDSGGRYNACVAFRPTGWVFGAGGAAGRSTSHGGGVRLVEVPYSEHSSYDELVACVRALRPSAIVATVSAGPRGDAHPGLPALHAAARG